MGYPAQCALGALTAGWAQECPAWTSGTSYVFVRNVFGLNNLNISLYLRSHTWRYQQYLHDPFCWLF
jgi:hypothetical protein